MKSNEPATVSTPSANLKPPSTARIFVAPLSALALLLLVAAAWVYCERQHVVGLSNVQVGRAVADGSRNLTVDSVLIDERQMGQVAGGSMAPTLHGKCLKFDCADCGFPVVIGQEPPVDSSNICPNCGHPNKQPTAVSEELGETVRVEPYAGTERIERGALVVIAQPQSVGELAIKRVIGLPGERVSIREGDCYIDEQLWRKSWAEFRRAAVLVHDDRYRVPTERKLPPRWEMDARESTAEVEPAVGPAVGQAVPPARWQRSAQGYRFSPAADDEEYQWLRYRHRCCYLSTCQRDQEVPVRDVQPLHQDVGRRLQIVRDLGVTANVQGSASGTTEAVVMMELDNGREAFRVELWLGTGRVITWRKVENSMADKTEKASKEEGKADKGDKAEIANNPLPGERADVTWSQLAETMIAGWEADQWHAVGVALCDQQLLVSIDNQVIEQAYEVVRERAGSEVAAGITLSTSRCCAIGARSGGVEVRELKIWRDRHWLHPAADGRDWKSSQPLGKDEYFVMGDNPAVSVDSRHWPARSVTVGTIRGVVAEGER